MAAETVTRVNDDSELRLLLEELCCDLCRFEHVKNGSMPPEDIRIDREVYLDIPGAFADIRVSPAALQPYFVEVKYGYSDDDVLRHLLRKYKEGKACQSAAKVILVIDQQHRPQWQRLEAELLQKLPSALKLEVWNEQRLFRQLEDYFQIHVEAINSGTLLEVRQAIDRAKAFYAFGGPSLAEYEHDPLKAELMWHFGFWRLRQLRESGQRTAREILAPGLYRGVAVLLADLCSFSSFVRDTPDAAIIRESLTSFYSKARYQIINNGGMMYQFVGDEVIGLFGLPERTSDYVARTLETARALVSIGSSVSHNWQRRIDRVQGSGGLHVGVAIGDLQIVSLRPFSRTHMGAIGDCINVAARLLAVGGSSELVVTNSFHRELDDTTQASFREVEPVEARNVGRVKAWKLSLGQPFQGGP